MLDWLRRFFGVKTEREVAKEILREPEIRRARRAIRYADRILHEIELTERGQRK